MNGLIDRLLRSNAKHFQERSAELQIPPLRCAPVGMTKGRVGLPFRFDDAEHEQHVPPLRFAPAGFFIPLGGLRRAIGAGPSRSGCFGG